MPFNFVLIEADREAMFFINQDPEKKLHVPKGGGILEAGHIHLSSWRIENLYSGANKIYVTVQKE